MNTQNDASHLSQSDTDEPLGLQEPVDPNNAAGTDGTCETCDGKGWYAHGETGNPQQIQCQPCLGTGKYEPQTMAGQSDYEPREWPSIEEQLEYWKTHDHGGNVLPSRIEANEERYQ